MLETKNKRILCYGAGGTLKDFLENNRAHSQIIDKIDFIFDRNEMPNTSYGIGLRKIPVTPLSKINECGIDFEKYVIVVCIAVNNIISVLKNFDNIPILDGVICYYGISGVSFGREHFVPALAGKQTLPLCNKKYTIPKIIHYIWFGNNPFGELEIECIESWSKFCSDYEIKFWNEENYDISKAPLYVQQAYETKKYAFVSDYARLDIVNQYGGFYLDTDVKLLRNLDTFINYKSVYGYLPYNEIATGLCFGSIPNNEDLIEQMKIYDNTEFLYDEKYNLTPCPEYTTDYFRNKGIDINNRVCLFDDNLFLPSDFFCGLMPVMCDNGLWHLPLYELTENTYAIHKCSSSWMIDENKTAFDNAKNNFAEINERLLKDYRRN
jgi:hypothetical protein